ncbi:MAG TPA: serine/threonine-protein kinase, partial [Ktedonobacteraceae bacterium]|nr:serine/threonine-protein kinase [Ktedonobacteraceae bacterium]
FLREAEVSAHLKHEHILPLFEFGEDQGRLFLVTPYIEGGTLARRLKSGPLSLAEVHQLFVPLVQAVAYIHLRGVIHRDLKPTNILLDEEDGQIYVRLIDFGIASFQGNTASPPLTTAGNEIGTIAYMAPERLSGVVAPSNDIFSLGVILYQLLTGNYPIGQQSLNLPEPLEYVVRRCIAIRPEDRFATADEVLQNFEHASQYLITSSQVLAPVVSTPPSSSYISGALNRPSNVPLSGEAQELVVLQDSGAIPVAPPAGPQGTFGREDYNAPTTWFDPAIPQVQQAAGGSPKPKKASPTGRRRGLLPLLSAIMVIVLLGIVFTGYYTYQAVTATSVIVDISPQMQVINQLYTITASPNVQTPDAGTTSIPDRVFSKTDQASLKGETTGQVCSVFGVFNCKRAVSQDDVDRLVSQMQPTLENKIAQALQQQVTDARGTTVIPVNPSIVSETANPPVGSIGKTVTVTLVEQGSTGYFANVDVESVARQLLTQQAQQSWRNYLLIPTSITMSTPIVEGVDPNSGKVTIEIAAGGVAAYQFSSTQLQSIENALKNKKVSAARNYLMHLPGINPKTVGIHFTSGGGDTLPGDIQKIKIVTGAPGNLPNVQLQNVPAPTFTPSTDSGTTASPTASPTQTGDNN